MERRIILYSSILVSILSPSLSVAQVSHTMIFERALSGRHVSHTSGEETQEDQVLEISLSTDEDRKSERTSTTKNGITNTQEHNYSSSVTSQAIETGHLQRTTKFDQSVVYDFQIYSTTQVLDFSY